MGISREPFHSMDSIEPIGSSFNGGRTAVRPYTSNGISMSIIIARDATFAVSEWCTERTRRRHSELTSIGRE
jgi:hypothetical protein